MASIKTSRIAIVGRLAKRVRLYVVVTKSSSYTLDLTTKDHYWCIDVGN